MILLYWVENVGSLTQPRALHRYFTALPMAAFIVKRAWADITFTCPKIFKLTQYLCRTIADFETPASLNFAVIDLQFIADYFELAGNFALQLSGCYDIVREEQANTDCLGS